MPPVTWAWETQAAFRRANEDLLAKRWELFADEPDAPAPFLCECADRRCTRVLRLTVAAYEHIHADRAQFIVLPGHELSTDIEDVVQQDNEFVVVRKLEVSAHSPA
jgi:hypothetical protein